MRRVFGVRSRGRWLKPSWFRKRRGHRVATHAAAQRLVDSLDRRGRPARVSVPPALRASKRSRLLEIARREIGTIESGPNTSPRIKVYQASTSVPGTGWPWCQAFVRWAARGAGYKMPYVGAYVPHFEQWARDAGRWVASPADARPGDAVVFGFGQPSAVHVGILEKALPQGIVTIEGNTSPGSLGSQSNGGGVWRRERSYADVRGFVRLV